MMGTNRETRRILLAFAEDHEIPIKHQSSMLLAQIVQIKRSARWDWDGLSSNPYSGQCALLWSAPQSGDPSR